MADKMNWKEWNEERESFANRETEGFTLDLKALEAHIKRLTKVCPKDEAGWPTVTALRVIDKLTEDHNVIKHYLALTLTNTKTPPNQILEG